MNAVGTAVKSTSGYAVADRLKINGSSFTGGADGTNDAIIEITPVDGTGGITNFSTTGTAPDGQVTYNAVGQTSTTGSGASATFDITRTGTLYNTVNINAVGANYIATETITIAGTELGGASPANDLTIVVDTVDTGGEILTFTPTGTAVNSGSQQVKVQEVLLVTEQHPNVSTGGSIQTRCTSRSKNTTLDRNLESTGNLLAGATPTNDLEITIAPNGTGGIQQLQMQDLQVQM